MEAQAWAGAVEAWLPSLRVPAGARVLDLGCGAVGILAPLARLVGRSGQVFGLDSDPVQIAAARAHVRTAGLANVTLTVGDLYQTPWPAATFDLVHARFISVTPTDYARLIEEMIRVTAPGGWVALEEPIAQSWQCFPSDPAWERLRETILAGWRAIGIDLNAGQQTYRQLRRAGLRDVGVAARVLALRNDQPYRRLPLHFAEARRAEILAAGVFDEAGLSALLDECAAILDHPDTFVTTFVLTQTAGQKA